MNSGAGDTTQLVPGFPIRTPWDHSSVDSSPRPNAASHVLHRLLVPRHPPCALSNLTTKMLASTVQFSTNNHPHQPTPPPKPRGTQHGHRTGWKNQEPKPPPPQPSQHSRHDAQSWCPGFVFSGPNRMSVATPPPTTHTFHTHPKQGRVVLAE
jgi:hypothetical protein